MDEDENKFKYPTLDDWMRQALRDMDNHIYCPFAAYDPVYMSPPDQQPRGRSLLTPAYTNWVHPKYTTQITIVSPDDPDPRYSVYGVWVDLTWTPTVPAPIAGTGGVHISVPPVADPYPDLRPRVPVQYSQSLRARQRSAVFTGKAGGCLRCGRELTGQPVVNVAPATLPPATVHVGCVEVDDQIGARDADT